MAVCNVVTDQCIEPAGWGTSLGYFVNKGSRLRRCSQCGEPACSACSTVVGRSILCLSCQAGNVFAAGLA